MLTELQLLMFMTYGWLDNTLVCALTLAAPSSDDVNAVNVMLLGDRPPHVNVVSFSCGCCG